jgi:hypothetical protein
MHAHFLIFEASARHHGGGLQSLSDLAFLIGCWLLGILLALWLIFFLP